MSISDHGFLNDRARLIAKRAFFPITVAALLSACCTPTVIRRPVPVIAPPCLGRLPPSLPTTDEDAAWTAYHRAMEAYVAYVVEACGAHLLAEDAARWATMANSSASPTRADGAGTVPTLGRSAAATELRVTSWARPDSVRTARPARGQAP